MVCSGAHPESVQVTASGFSEFTNWIARLQARFRSEFDLNAVAEYICVHGCSGTPAVIERVNAEVMKALATPEVIAKLESMGVDAAKPNRPADFAAFMKDDVAKWKTVVKQAQIATD